MTTPSRLAVIIGVLTAALLGWVLAGLPGAAIGLAIGVAIGVLPWRGQPVWSWLTLWRRRSQPIQWHEPVTVANDRAGGGIRFQDGVAVAAVQLLGKPHAPTLLTGSMSTHTDNAVDVASLQPLLQQSLGLRVDS